MKRLALDVATAAHAGQFDKAGEPYIEHPKAVAGFVEHWGPLHYATALLHDVIEDTDETPESLLAAGIPERVVAAVECLTHRPNEPRTVYYGRVKSDPIALVVKRADVRHNASEERLALLPPADAERLRTKYRDALVALAAP